MGMQHEAADPTGLHGSMRTRLGGGTSKQLADGIEAVSCSGALLTSRRP